MLLIWLVLIDLRRETHIMDSETSEIPQSTTY